LTVSSEDARRRERFRAIYTANYPFVLGYALRRCPQAEDAADVVAETFLTAWRRLDDVPRGHSRTWLYGIARRVLANHARGRRRRHRLGERLREELREVAATEQNLQRQGELEDVAAAFACLSERDREILALAAWEGLAAADLGRVLGCSSNAARIRLHRARRRLARHLGSLDESPVDQRCTSRLPAERAAAERLQEDLS
jgi:RNA polymerase sigma factor (sigma-70 family)